MEWLRGIAIIALIVVGIWVLLVALIWLHRPSRHLAGAAVRLLPDTLRMLRAVIADPATPRTERWLLIGLFAWLASPIDLLPEFLPGIGPLDDIVVAALVLRRVSRRLGRDYLRALVRRRRRLLAHRALAVIRAWGVIGNPLTRERRPEARGTARPRSCADRT